MDEGKLVADFVASNIDKILSIGKHVFGYLDEKLQIKLRTAYTNYLERTLSRYSKAKSFFIRDKPVDLYEYYVPIGLRCGTYKLTDPSPTSCFRRSTRIVITGSGGCGKSILMRHLFLCSILDGQYVPIFVELRDLNSREMDFRVLVEHILEQHHFDISGSYLTGALEAGHLVLFLDGYDEVYPTRRPKLIRDIRTWSEKYPKCPIALSTRPDDVVQSLDEFLIYSVMPLDLGRALELIAKLPYDDDIRQKFSEDLKRGMFQQHRSFLSNPLLLSIMLLTYGENAEIPKKLSVFYNQAYEALFQRHDASKGGFRRKRKTELDIQDFARIFALFCLQTYEKRLFKMSSLQALEFIDKARTRLDYDFLPENYLSDLLSATCLVVEDGLEIMFTHRSFQEYFVSVYIVSASDEIQCILMNRYWKYVISDNVIDLVEELNPESIERNLLIPKLKHLFSQLRVSRAVGITHAARYIKMAYSRIEFHNDKIVAQFSETEEPIPVLLDFANRICATYTFPDKEYFDNERTRLIERYMSNRSENTDEQLYFDTKKMSHRTSPLRDFLEGEGAFSVSYVRAGYRALKQLEKKHDERLESLDRLLNL